MVKSIKKKSNQNETTNKSIVSEKQSIKKEQSAKINSEKKTTH